MPTIKPVDKKRTKIEREKNQGAGFVADFQRDEKQTGGIIFAFQKRRLRESVYHDPQKAEFGFA